MSDHIVKLPVRIRVQEIISSRYPGHKRPESWDSRKAGVDVIRSEEGKTLRLLSDGQQSPPQPSWELIISDGDAESGYKWTLYGVPASH